MQDEIGKLSRSQECGIKGAGENPQRPVERHWSPPCLGCEFMSNSIGSSKDKMTLDNAWVRLAMAYPVHPPPYYQSKWSKMQTKVCYFSSWSLSMAPQSIQNQVQPPSCTWQKGPSPHSLSYCPPQTQHLIPAKPSYS